MNVINKQTFLNELSGLLTFMTEEDRLEALTLYERMFDDTDDEQALIQALLSPTRQAVVIARAYDASARKQRRADRARDEEETTPDFVLAILHAYEESVPLSLDAEPLSSLPGESELLREAAGTQPLDAAVPSLEGNDDAEPRDEVAAPEQILAADPEDVLIGTVTVRETPAIVEDEELLLEETAEKSPLAWISVSYDEDEEGLPEQTVRRPKVFLLIVFILLAVPLTLMGVVLLLIPTLLSLLLASGAFAAGGAGVMTAFSGFTLFSEKLIVLGCSIIVLALGILFLWLFAWFVGGAIGGLIRSVLQLGKSWCYEEVPA